MSNYGMPKMSKKVMKMSKIRHLFARRTEKPIFCSTAWQIREFSAQAIEVLSFGHSTRYNEKCLEKCLEKCIEIWSEVLPDLKPENYTDFWDWEFGIND
jgi:hypothetical protein